MLNKIIVGIDEVGRGSLISRVYASAVILKQDIKIEGLRDSKQLSDSQRRILFTIICNQALDIEIGFASVEEINKLNILNATFLAMQRALDQIQIKYDEILVDGNIFPFKNKIGQAIIKGDSIIPEIMAASIIAKVIRDDYVRRLDRLFPQYNWKQNKGYGTQEHIEAIKKFGICEQHRIKFVSKFKN